MNLMLLIFAEAWESVNAYRLRSFLTMLGIIVGVCAVILTLAIGEGTRARIQKALKMLGTNELVITPGAFSASGVSGAAGEMVSLTISDAESIGELGNVAAVAPAIQTVTQVVAGAQNWKTTVIGSTPDILMVRGHQIAEGEMFTDNDVRTGARVAVLGKTVAENLFPDGQAVGASIRVHNNLSMQVVGVLKGSGQSMTGHNQDDQMLVPIKTARRQLFGSIMPDNVSQITLTVKSSRLMYSTQREITNMLRERKHLKPDDDLPFTVMNLEAIAEAATQTAKTTSLFLVAAASISLIVGGIGIMNIMLVSVVERTREIGVRKAIGASEPIVMAQFLAEALALCLGGCFIGIALGYALNHAIGRLTGLETTISLFSVLISVAVAGLTGLIFGFFPALKAARLQPAEALRSN